MSYELRYHTNLCKNLRIPKKRKKPITLAKWLILTALLVLSICLPDDGFWKNFLIPGDSSLTESAVEVFAENLKEGSSIEEAFQKFCLEIVKSE